MWSSILRLLFPDASDAFLPRTNPFSTTDWTQHCKARKVVYTRGTYFFRHYGGYVLITMSTSHHYKWWNCVGDAISRLPSRQCTVICFSHVDCRGRWGPTTFTLCMRSCLQLVVRVFLKGGPIRIGALPLPRADTRCEYPVLNCRVLQLQLFRNTTYLLKYIKEYRPLLYTVWNRKTTYLYTTHSTTVYYYTIHYTRYKCTTTISLLI